MLMNPDSMIKLIGSGTTRGVEDQWMTLIEGDDAGIERLRDYAPVFSELKRGGHQAQAAALAWTAIAAGAVMTVSPGHQKRVGLLDSVAVWFD